MGAKGVSLAEVTRAPPAIEAVERELPVAALEDDLGLEVPEEGFDWTAPFDGFDNPRL